MNYIKIKLCSLLIILLPAFANTQNIDSLKPDDIFNMSIEDMLRVKVSVASTVPAEVFNSPSSVSVINRDMIDQYNFISVAEAIRQVSGVDVLQTVIDKNVPTIRGILQNFYANKVLIMINNVPVWNPSLGNTSIDRISINDVERIEVLKGPASVLYGTNAYNGVINIILRNPEQSNLHAQINGGYPNIGAASVSYGEKKGDFMWNISGNSSLEIRKPVMTIGAPDEFIIGNESLYATDTAYMYKEELRNSNLNANLKYKGHTLFINTFTNSYAHPGAYASYSSGANRNLTDRGSLISYKFDYNFSDKTSMKINTYYDYHNREFTLSQAIETQSRIISNRIAASGKLNHTINKLLKFEVGGEIFNGQSIESTIFAVTPDTLVSNTMKTNKGITEGSIFTQLNFIYNWFSINGGLRFTQNNNFGGDLSPQVAAMFTLNQANKIKLIYGQSFRTPNLIELYFDHSSIKGNPNLKPEKCESIELIYMTQIKKFFGQVTAYYGKYSNLIQRVHDTTNMNTTPYYDNATSFDGYGIELEARYQHKKVFNATVNYNYASGNDYAQKKNYKFVPKHTLALGVNKPIKHFFASSNIYLYSSSQGHLYDIPSQHLLDFHLGYKHQSTKGINLIHTISFKNITNNQMLTPEYIRQRENVNEIATTGYGRRVIYTLKINF